MAAHKAPGATERLILVGRRRIHVLRLRIPVGRLRIPIGRRAMPVGRRRIHVLRLGIPVGRRRMPVGLRMPVSRRGAVAIVVARHDRHGLVIAKLMITVRPDKASWRSRIDLAESGTVWPPARLVPFPRMELRLVGLGVTRGLTQFHVCRVRRRATHLRSPELWIWSSWSPN